MIEITIDKKKIKRVVFFLLLIIVLVVTYKFTKPLFMGYKAAIMNSVNLLNKQEQSQALYEKYAVFDSQYDMMQFLNEIKGKEDKEYADYVEGLKLKYGSKYKITYDISSETEISEAELKDIQESIKKDQDELDAYIADMKDYCKENSLNEKDEEKLLKLCEKIVKDYSDVKVTKGYKVELDCKIDGSLGFMDFSIKNLIIAKINGQWIFVGYYGEEEKVYYMANPINPEIIYSKVENWY